MAKEKELREKLWKALKSDMTVMLGLTDDVEGDARPMTAQIEGDEQGPIWFFTAKDTEIAQKLKTERPAFATFASKSHDLFAAIHGTLMLDMDRDAIDRLWNPYVAAWFEKGKDDPKLALLRFEPERAEVWVDASSLVAGIKILLGFDPKKEYRDKTGEVRLGR
ncbi:pyridoxamine 5'-phosphate oxidase family protein [Taklimakanibacter deserti]|uniref:pyridoxamine 5'-phosphate oxidase family protein n=1 Tax=Taklimakanibacter deserti TaxID=2267839 RepID=UPI000E64E3A1